MNRDTCIGIGMRINKISWFKGTIKTIKMTPKSLKPEDFIFRP